MNVDPAPIVCCNGQVAIHRRDIRQALPDIAILDPGEMTRYHRFAQADDAARYLVGRHLVKTVLGQVVGRRPHDITVAIGDAERPYVAGAPDFNLSHSGKRVVLAWARQGRVGVDIEPYAREAQVRTIISRIADMRELDGFGDTPCLRLWCIKEAIAKALGEGLRRDFRSITIEAQTLPHIALDGLVQSDWLIEHMPDSPENLLVCAFRA